MVVDNLSFPRSGNALLITILRKYYGLDNFILYSDCGVVDDFNWRKNHDFNHDTEINPGWYYVVQIRNPVRSIVSIYNEHIKLGNFEDSEDSWRRLSKRQTDNWRKFMIRWTVRYIDNRFVLTYEGLINKPEESINDLLSFLGEDFSQDKVATIIQSSQIRPRANLEVFKYYDSDYFNHLEGKLWYYIDYLNLPRWKEGV